MPRRQRNELELIISASADRAAKEIASFSKRAKRRFKETADAAESAFKGITREVFSLKTAIGSLVAGYGLQRLVDSFIDTAASVEQMQVALDTLTKGHGAEWFRKLNEWAMKMPVNTEKAIETFIMLRAMGLRPTTEMMTTLVDTMAATGKGEEALEGIARALGQIQAKGKLSMEELNQLAEWGVPAKRILAEGLGVAVAQIEKLASKGLDANRVLKILFEGLKTEYGGLSSKLQTTWKGLMESLRSYWTEFKREVMEAGPFRTLKRGLADLVKKLDEAFKTGRFKTWATEVASVAIRSFEIIADVGVTAFKTIAIAAQGVTMAVSGWREIFGLGVKAFANFRLKALQKEKKSIEEYLASEKRGSLEWYVDRDKLRAIEEKIAQLKEWKEAGSLMLSANIHNQKELNRILDESRERVNRLHSSVKSYLKELKQTPSPPPGAPSATGALTGPPPAPPSSPSGAPSSELLETYRRIHEQVLAETRRMTELSVDEQIRELNKWYRKAIDIYRKTGKDTTELMEYYLSKRREILEQGARAWREIHKEVQDKIDQMTQSTTEYKLKKLNEWLERSKAIYEKQGRDTTELYQYYTLRKEQILKESSERQKELHEEATQEALSAYQRMYETLREFGYEDYEFRKMLIEREAEELQRALKDRADAEALVNAWRQAEQQKLKEEQWAREHEFMNALREHWGLTWQEIRQGAVNIWQDIGRFGTAVFDQIGSAITSVVTGMTSIKDAIKTLLQSLLSAAVQTLANIGAQILILKLIGASMMAAITAGTVTSMGAIATAAAPAAELVSIATFGSAAAAGSAAFMSAMGAMSALSAAMIGASMAAASGAATTGAALAFAAKGGIFTRPALAVFGEEGPEAVVPLSERRRREARAIMKQIVRFVPDLAFITPAAPELTVPLAAEGGIFGASSLPLSPLPPPPAPPPPAAVVLARPEEQPIVQVEMHFHGDVRLDAELDEIRENIGLAVEDAIRGALS